MQAAQWAAVSQQQSPATLIKKQKILLVLSKQKKRTDATVLMTHFKCSLRPR